jgi:hypothetical protein
MTSSVFHKSRQLRTLQIIFAGAAAVAMLALFDAAQPDAPQSVLASGSVRLVDDSSDQAQLQQQLATQEMLQSEQQAEQQNEAAQQQAQLDEQQAQIDEQLANNP